MSDLKTSYERELQLLRRGLAEFGSRNQRVAARLGVAGEHSEDMHVERMLQTAALLNARVLERLDDDVPDFTVPLLEVVYPEYLRPFPSCSIACFEPSAAVEQLSRPAVVRRGTHLTTRAGEYGFRTVYDVTLSPLSIDEAVYRLPTAVPSSVQLPESASGVISISFFVRSESVPFAAAAPDKARMFVDAPDLVTASAIDALVHRARSAFVEVDSSGRWSALDRVPVSSAGFDPDDAVIERRDGQQSAYRLLLEYFGYPQKFHFLDFHLGEVLRGRTIRRRLTIHIPVFGFHPDSPAALSLRGFEARNFRLGCSPVVNLVKAAKEMCHGYGININSAMQAVGRPGRSRHNYGAAVDLNITGYVGKRVKDVTGHDVQLSSFADLKQVGHGYGVNYYPHENMHWSDTGH